jgi:acetyl-CoA decarbonylase/synthase complex subunit gamma
VALTALQILKLLPQTNCKDCGFPTCLAFALKLGAKAVELSACPHASEEAKETLGAAASPPIRPVKIGVGDFSVKTGEETVMFRHEKTFTSPTLIGAAVRDDCAETELEAKIKRLAALRTERAGCPMHLDVVALRSAAGAPGPFQKAAQLLARTTDMPLVLIARSPAVMRAALDVSAGKRPLLCSADKENWEAMAALAAEFRVPLAVHADGDLRELADLSVKIAERGVKDLVLDPGSETLRERLAHQTLLRRSAILKRFRPFGYPTLAFVPNSAGRTYGSSLSLLLGICKYASILIADEIEDWQLLPTLTLRNNIFTDPQRPLQLNAGIYPVGEPTPEAPLLVTTNFSLTYFVVSGEVESAQVPAHILLVDTEGMSVLTAWSAGKFTGPIVAEAVKKSGIEGRLSHRKIVIPGYAAVIQGDLEDALPGWEIRVGPQESAGIPRFLREYRS